MARFDVYRPRAGGGYLLDSQANVLSQLNTRLVVPLLSPGEGPPPIARLNPSFQVRGDRVIMYTQFTAAIPEVDLGGRVASLADETTRS